MFKKKKLLLLLLLALYLTLTNYNKKSVAQTVIALYNSYKANSSQRWLKKYINIPC